MSTKSKMWPMPESAPVQIVHVTHIGRDKVEGGR
jgi:hypothetical protein